MLLVSSVAECRDQRGTLLAENDESLIFQALAPAAASEGTRAPGARPDPDPGQDDLPSVERTITLTDMIRYAGATWDWHQLHYDPDYLASVGLDRPVVDGQMLGAMMAAQLEERGRLRSLRYRFRSMVFAGETVRVESVPSAASASSPDALRSFDQTVRVGDRVCVTGGGTVEVPNA